MRLLRKNQRPFYYALPIAVEPIVDEYGNETLEMETIYSDPKALKANYSAAVGEEAVRVFGSATEYSRIIAFPQSCPLIAGAILWIGIDTTESANYKVARIADGVTGTLVAISEMV